MNRKTFLQSSATLAFGLGAAQLLQAQEQQNGRRPRAGAKAEPLVINAGIGGNNTRNLLKRLETDCLQQQPELVILMVGTNDMNHGKYVPLEEYRVNLRKLSGGILATGSHLLMLTILPFYEPYLLTRHPAEFYQPEGAQARRVAVNQAIKTVAAEQKSSLFDIGSVFEKVGKIGTHKDSLLRNELNSGKTDGVHPTQNGYRFLGSLLAQYILDQQLPYGRVVCFGDSITKGDGSIDKESYPAYMKSVLT